MKKRLALLAAFIVLLSSFASGCKKGGTSSEATGGNNNAEIPVNSELEGKELVIMTRVDIEVLDGEDTNEDSYMFKALLNHSLNEFCQANKCTWSQLCTNDTKVMTAAIASGQSPDLYFGYSIYPSGANLGILQDISSEYDFITKKYGTNTMDPMKFKGAYYGVSAPWNELLMVKYNRDFFEENGIKTPRQYFEEGTWNYENYIKCCKEATLDLDSDGKLDTFTASSHQMSKLLVMSAFNENPDGTVVNTFDTERNRAIASLLNQLYSYGAMITNNLYVGETNNATGQIGVMSYANVDIYNIIGATKMGMWTSNKDGSYNELCPPPVWKEGDPGYGITKNMWFFGIPVGADKETSMSLMDYIMEAGVVTYMKMPGTYEFDYQGLRGTTEGSKAYIAYTEERIETEKEKVKSNPYYDEEWQKKVIDYANGQPHVIQRDYSTSFTTAITSKEAFNVLWTLPVATSIPQVSAKLDLQIKDYNDNLNK